MLNTKQITVVLVEDHKLVREAWAQLFRETEGFTVAGTSGDFNEAINLIKNKQPDIVLLDINLADHSGFQAVPWILKFSPGTKIIAVSMHNQPVYVKKMLHLGAKGYVTKNSSQAEMLHAVGEVIAGNKFICAEIKDIISAQLLEDTSGKTGVKDLTAREVDIIDMVKKGLSSKEIAEILSISTRTAEVHRHNILKKLHLKNTASLINFINTGDLSF